MGEVVWERAGCQLVCGDGPDVLSGLRDVRAVIADPPYACLDAADIAKPASRRTGHGGRVRRNAVWEVDEAAWAALISRLMAAAAVAVTDGWVHVWCAAELLGQMRSHGEAHGLRYHCPFAFCKTNPVPRIRSEQWQSAVETAGVFSVGKARFTGNHPNWYCGPFEYPAGRWHETQKSLDLVRYLVERYTEPGDLVCDPCAGSANIITACLSLGRRCVAVELDPAICEVARIAFTAGIPAARRAFAARGGMKRREYPLQMDLID